MNFREGGGMMEGKTTTTTVLARGRSDHPATWALGSLFERVASGTETGGAFALSLVTQPGGTATPLHVHSAEAEAFFLLDGTMTYRAGEQTHQLGHGSFIYLPSGVPHAFRVTGTSPARFLAIAAPGRLMDLYDEVGGPRTGSSCRTPTTSRCRPRSDAGWRQLQATASRLSARRCPSKSRSRSRPSCPAALAAGHEGCREPASQSPTADARHPKASARTPRARSRQAQTSVHCGQPARGWP